MKCITETHSLRNPADCDHPLTFYCRHQVTILASNENYRQLLDGLLLNLHVALRMNPNNSTKL